jgi:beta-lactamase regulating signal transducer with metallopeptidase domain
VPDGAGGFFLFLFESYAARALLGSLVAALLIQLLLARDVVRSPRGRRLLLLVPFAVTGVLAGASVNRGFLPNVWIDTDRIGPAGALLDVLGDVQIIGGTVDLLVAGYVTVVVVLLGRRAAGVLSARRLRRRSLPAPAVVRHRALRLAVATGIAPPEVRLRPDCPGGAFTTGVRRSWIALDPELAVELDGRELDALLAHEMAHIRRRDPLLTLLTGACRDLTFFLPGIHLAVRWLRHEQEEAADDLAAHATRRPGALASTILKVWESQTGRAQLVNACAAVAPAALRLPAWWPAGRVRRPHVMVRVERLISPLQALTHLPRRRDVGLPLTVATLAICVGVTIPAWLTQVLDNDGVLLRVFAAPEVVQVESPAFATFRAMAPADRAVRRTTATSAGAATRAGADASLCPCIESPAQLRAGRAATATPEHSQLVWSSDGRDAWELQRLHEQARLRVNGELLSFRGGRREVGFFTVSRNSVER